jgi:hypothetical protein
MSVFRLSCILAKSQAVASQLELEAVTMPKEFVDLRLKRDAGVAERTRALLHPQTKFLIYLVQKYHILPDLRNYCSSQGDLYGSLLGISEEEIQTCKSCITPNGLALLFARMSSPSFAVLSRMKINIHENQLLNLLTNSNLIKLLPLINSDLIDQENQLSVAYRLKELVNSASSQRVMHWMLSKEDVAMGDLYSEVRHFMDLGFDFNEAWKEDSFDEGYLLNEFGKNPETSFKLFCLGDYPLRTYKFLMAQGIVNLSDEDHVGWTKLDHFSIEANMEGVNYCISQMVDSDVYNEMFGSSLACYIEHAGQEKNFNEAFIEMLEL